MSLGNGYENKALDRLLGTAAAGDPATVYLALFTVTPGETGGGTEVTGSGYARVAITNNGTNFPAAAAGVKTNGVDFSFPEATTDYSAAVTGWALLDHASAAPSATNVIAYDDFAAPQTILAGVTPRVLAGDLTITAD